MRDALLVGITVCVVILIGVLFYSIKKKRINLPEIIVSVISIVVSILLAFFFNGETETTQEGTSNIFNTESAITTTDDKSEAESIENDDTSVCEQTSEESNSSHNESVNQNEDDVQGVTDDKKGEDQNDAIENSSKQENENKIVPLYETKTYLQEGSITREEITSDPRGNTYSNAYVFWAEYSTLNTGSGYYDKPYLEKYLGGMYDEFTMKIIPSKDFDKYNKSIVAVVKIYADEKLIYTSNSITRKTDCEEINISVDNVNYLKIELNAGTDLSSYYNQYSVIIYDAKLTTK